MASMQQQILKSVAPAAVAVAAHYFGGPEPLVSKSTLAAVLVVQLVALLNAVAMRPMTPPQKKIVEDEDEEVTQKWTITSIPPALLYVFGAVGVMLFARLLKSFGFMGMAWCWVPFALGGAVRAAGLVWQAKGDEIDCDCDSMDENSDKATNLNEEWRELEFWQELDKEWEIKEDVSTAKEAAKAALVAASAKIGC